MLVRSAYMRGPQLLKDLGDAEEKLAYGQVYTLHCIENRIESMTCRQANA